MLDTLELMGGTATQHRTLVGLLRAPGAPEELPEVTIKIYQLKVSSGRNRAPQLPGLGTAGSSLC